MDSIQYQQIRNYREQNQLFLQMKMECEVRELAWQIEKFQVLEHTIPTTLLKELEPLQYRINLLIQQLKKL